VGVLLKAMLDYGRLYRWQAGLLLIVVFIPWFVNVLTISLRWRPLWGLDLTPVSLALTVSVAGWMLLRLEIRDLSPVARHLVIDQMRDGVLVLNAEHLIMDLNPVLLDLLQRPKRELLGRPITRFWPDWSGEFLGMNQETGTAVEWTWGESEPQTFDVQWSPLFDGRNRLVSHVIVLRDIADRKKIEERLKASLNEKEVLLKEVHHRVKNNLQIISSLLNLQSGQAQNEVVTQALQEGQNRVRSMALIHETLYRSGNLSRVDFGEYIRRLAEQLHHTYSTLTAQVVLSVETDKIFLTMETAVPCGLILNELVSNAFKHAFVDGRSGQITIRLQVDDNNCYHLTVNDNGIGLPSHLDFHQTGTLGLQLVNTLVYQLQGNLTVANQQGTSISITFAEETPKETS
jgi:two-component sensor histidine kinase